MLKSTRRLLLSNGLYIIHTYMIVDCSKWERERERVWQKRRYGLTFICYCDYENEKEYEKVKISFFLLSLNLCVFVKHFISMLYFCVLRTNCKNLLLTYCKRGLSDKRIYYSYV